MNLRKLTLVIVVAAIVIPQLIPPAVEYLRLHWFDGTDAPINSRAIIVPPPGATIDLTHLPSLGDKAAEVVMVEFSDYQCPFCRKHSNGVALTLRNDYVDKGLLRYAFANNPLSIHKSARLLAFGANCADRQGRFWAMHDALFAKVISKESDLTALAAQLGLGKEKFAACLKSDSQAQEIERDQIKAEQLGLQGTPAFAIGIISSSDKLLVKRLVVGAQSIQVFKKAFEEARDSKL